MCVRATLTPPLAGAAAACAALIAPASAQTIVVPNSLAATEGAGANAFPLCNISQYHRNQQVYSAHEFGNLGGPHRLLGVRFRPNGTSTSPGWSATVDLDLRFSVTTSGPDQLVSTFASNIGTNEQVVYSGQATYGSTQVVPGPTPPLAFDIEIMFQTPYIYDPSDGNLLMDFLRTSTTITTNRFADAQGVTGDGVSRVYTSTLNNATGSVDSIGLVTQFIFEPLTGACYANCDSSTATPVLNVADFTCFLTKFAAGDPWANCDSSTATPVLNVADFTCFLTKFAGGCS